MRGRKYTAVSPNPRRYSYTIGSIDRSLGRHSGDQETPSPLNISHIFEFENDYEDDEVPNEDHNLTYSKVSVLTPIRSHRNSLLSNENEFIIKR
jgi:hypothetical protein